MGTAIAGGDRVDVLIVTAVKEEYDAVLAVHAGALRESGWTTRREPSGLDVAYRFFVASDGGHLRVAVIQSLGMGGVQASTSWPLAPHSKPATPSGPASSRCQPPMRASQK